MAAKKKSNPKASPTLERKKLPDIKLPEKIVAQTVTGRSLGKGNYQKKILAAVAHILIPDMMNAIRRNLHIDDMAAAKLTAELYGMAGKKDAGIVLNVNQQNNNVAESRASRDSGGPMSFEHIQQILEEEEKARRAIPASFEPVFEPTPGSLIEG
jgi:hypothetical protein